MDPRDTVDKAGTNPNRGMNTRSYLAIVVVAVLLVIGVLLVSMLGSGGHGKTGAQTPATTSGQNSPTPQ